MKCEYLPTFLRDYRALKDKRVEAAIDRATDQAEAAATPAEIRHLKRLAGHTGYYRIRVGHYRIGLRIDGDTIVFMRCGHRREIYRRFP